MKKGFSILIVSVVIIGIVISLVGIALTSQAAPLERPEKPDKHHPVFATNVELVKKGFLEKPGHAGEHGGGQDKNKKVKTVATGDLGVPAPVTGDRFAVVVGISDYPGSDNDLNYCDDDAEEMAQALTEVYGFTNVILLKDSQATRSAILSAIDDIPMNAGEIVFFFSGHGTRGIADDGDKEKVDEAIVTHDSKNLVPIWDGELRLAFDEFQTSRIIFIFDTCLAGGMKKDLGAPGRVIAMAATENGTAYEIGSLENGEFSYYFIDEGMLQGKANTHDYDDDGGTNEPEQVTVEEAFDYTKANCSYDRPTVGDYFENDLLLGH